MFVGHVSRGRVCFKGWGSFGRPRYVSEGPRYVWRDRVCLEGRGIC